MGCVDQDEFLPEDEFLPVAVPHSVGNHADESFVQVETGVVVGFAVVAVALAVVLMDPEVVRDFEGKDWIWQTLFVAAFHACDPKLPMVQSTRTIARNISIRKCGPLIQCRCKLARNWGNPQILQALTCSDVNSFCLNPKNYRPSRCCMQHSRGTEDVFSILACVSMETMCKSKGINAINDNK